MTQPNMNDILAKAQEMQAQLQQAQQEIVATTVTGSAGNGLVEISMTGGGSITDVSIKPEVVDPEDVETLQDLITGAFEDARQKVSDLAEQKMGPLSQGMGADDLGGLLG